MNLFVRNLFVEAHICGQCNLPIVGNYLLINGKFIHPAHYRCEECGIEFKGGDCNEFEGDYYCRQVQTVFVHEQKLNFSRSITKICC